jgi:hypothetical protein
MRLFATFSATGYTTPPILASSLDRDSPSRFDKHRNATTQQIGGPFLSRARLHVENVLLEPTGLARWPHSEKKTMANEAQKERAATEALADASEIFVDICTSATTSPIPRSPEITPG